MQPNLLGMLGLPPEILGVQGLQTAVSGLPAGITPAAMIQVCTVDLPVNSQSTANRGAEKKTNAKTKAKHKNKTNK